MLQLIIIDTLLLLLPLFLLALSCWTLIIWPQQKIQIEQDYLVKKIVPGTRVTMRDGQVATVFLVTKYEVIVELGSGNKINIVPAMIIKTLHE